ncbi:P63C domain-containing protein [Corallococcus sp. RDP092CA]|uniref:P63C domain-containing protein n=1 Tax=Corallococcus sp. RDP092CA TaxID=3109369 RepID=UPI0035B21F84
MPRCKPAVPPSRVLKAEYDAVLNIGGVELPCYVLNNGVRALSQAGVLAALGMSRGSSSSSGGDRLARFVALERLKPFVSEGLTAGTTSPLLFHPKGGGPAIKGYEATVLADLCDAIMRADIEGVLQKQQAHIARQARVVALGFMKLGIIGLVDEATGYQQQRAPDALQALLDRFLREEPSTWEKRFFSDFYEPLYRVCGMQPRGGNHPRLFASMTRFLVYRRILPPGALEVLDERNPADERGQRRVRHHQFLTAEIGVGALREHLAELRALMRLAGSLDELIWYVDRAFPLAGKTKELPFFQPPVAEPPRRRAGDSPTTSR